MSSGDTSLAELGIRLVGSLALVVGLMLLIARSVNKRFKAPTGAAIQVVHRQALGRGTGVAVVSVGTRVLVVGTTEQQVTLLAEIEPEEVGIGVTDDEYDDQDLVELPELPEVPALPTPARGGTHRATAPKAAGPVRPAAATGPLAGSVLSPQTWKQTLAAFTGQPAERGQPGVVPPRRRAS